MYIFSIINLNKKSKSKMESRDPKQNVTQLVYDPAKLQEYLVKDKVAGNKAAQKAVNDFPNVEQVAKIPGTTYAYYKLNPKKVQNLALFAEGGAKAPNAKQMPQITQKEFKEFRLGAIRSAKQPNVRFNFDQHKNQYDKIAAFIIQ